MIQERLTTPCGICGAEIHGEGTVCQECLSAFASGPGSETDLKTGSLDLAKYNSRMFPWEQITVQPRLISINPAWLIAALALVVLVLLLALLRTPLPSCWELSS
jgi:hypothetical protein